METLEDIYARIMSEDAERMLCSKTELSGTLEDMYARLMGQDEAVTAANPYGCNQHGEGWKMPHNGMSRVRKSDLHDKKKEKKRYFEPTEVRAQAKRNTASLLGGDLKKVYWGNNISVADINQFNEVMSEMMEKYPLTIGIAKLGSYTGRKDSEGACCEYYRNDDDSDCLVALKINQDHKYGGVHDFKNWKPYSAEVAKKTGYARHNVGATDKGIDVRAVMIHEYGHALHARAYVAQEFKHMLKNCKDKALVQELASSWGEWKSVYLRALKDKDIKKISEYSGDNPREFFAECFTARELGEKLPDYINSGLDNIIKLATKKA